MQAYTEILPPTAVTHAVRLPLLGPQTNNLVVAKTSLLQIFEILKVGRVNNTDVNGANGEDVQALTRKPSHGYGAPSEKNKLVLVAEFPLPGTVTSLAGIKIQNTKSGGHALLVALQKAKISLVEWDPENHSISTVSVHYYENEDLQGAPWSQGFSQCSSFLTVDPGNRCAALKFSYRQLAVLPFKQSGDDLVMGDYDPDLDTPPQSAVEAPKTNGDVSHVETPYAASFVLPLTVLDPALIYPIDLAFLYEYREPTLGILSSSRLPATSMLEKRKDMLSYTVFTLDLEQRARTPLLSVTGLPYDLFKIKPLPAPIGGVLLIGGNEVIHIDQAGKANGVGVNEFAKQCSSFAMADQSGLQLRLESCSMEQLSSNTGETLLVLASGELAVLNFNLDGRSVSGLSIHKISSDRGGSPLSSAASCVVAMDSGTLFLGSLKCNALVLSHHRKPPQLSRKRSHAEMLGLEEDNLSDEEISEDDDDLYGDSNASNNQQGKRSTSSAIDLTFAIDDRLPNLAPSGDVVIARHHNSVDGKAGKESTDIVLPTGRGFDSGLSILSKEINPNTVKHFGLNDVREVFSINGVGVDSNESQDRISSKYVLVSQVGPEGQESSSIHSVTTDGLEKLTETDVQSDYVTTNIHVVHGGKRIVQVSRSDIRSLEPDLSLVQMLPIENEDGQELKIVHTSFSDPYLLVVRDDASAVIFRADQEGEYEEVEGLSSLTNSKWVSGCLHKTDPESEPFLYLLSTEGALHILALPDLAGSLFVAANLSATPTILSSETISRRTIAKVNLTEVLVADLGDETRCSPHLIVRSDSGEITVYEPYHYPMLDSSSFSANLRWSKVLNVSLAREQTLSTESEMQYLSMRSIHNIDRLSMVFIPGETPSILVREAASSPRAIPFPAQSVRSVDAFHSIGCEHGLIIADENGKVSSATLPTNTNLGNTGWVTRNIAIGQDVGNLCYHEDTNLFILATDEIADFRLPEDERHKEWQDETTLFRPKVRQGIVKVLTTFNDTIIDQVTLEEYEQILSIKILNLVVSEITEERKNLVVVTTAIPKGESLNCGGSIYVFDIVDVVPEPERPETNKKLKLIVQEEVKAPVTAVAEIGDEGFLVGAQGQKCIVRGLKEDNTLLPVAFLDLQCYVTVLKTLRGPGGVGMALLGDVAKGLWFAGYAPEPYRMMLFGKSRSTMDVVSAEFLPHDKELFLVMADADCSIHVLQYNPEDPQSLQGQRLLNRTVFHTGHFTSSMTLIRSTQPDSSPNEMEDTRPPPAEQSHQIILSSASGALHLLTPLDEPTYRRLGALQNHLTTILDHTAGLNPKAFRAIESEGFGSRGLLDGDLLKRWMDLGTQRKAEASGRAGAESWQVRRDLERIGKLAL